MLGGIETGFGDDVGSKQLLRLHAFEQAKLFEGEVSGVLQNQSKFRGD